MSAEQGVLRQDNLNIALLYLFLIEFYYYYDYDIGFYLCMYIFSLFEILYSLICQAMLLSVITVDFSRIS